MMHSEHIPPAWDYNPSTWWQRIPLVFIALVGFLIALYLGFYQIGIFPTVWEPFFGDGSERVLHSKVSRAFPVSDALLGAFGYVLDVINGTMWLPVL